MWELSADGLLLVAILARIIPAIWIAPFAGGRLVPATVKLAVSLVLALVLHPLMAPSAAGLQGLAPLALAAVLLKEVLIGAGIGFVVALFFWAAEAAGWLIDRSRAASVWPANSPLATLMLLMSILLFLTLGGHRIFLVALAGSYEAVPLLIFPTAEGVAGFCLLCVRLTADLLLVAVSLAAPVLATLWLADVALGIAGRFSPASGSFFFSMPLRAVLGLLVVALALATLGEVIPEVLESGLRQVDRALGELRN